MQSALEVESQAALAVTLLTERVDRTGAFAADGSVSMAAWLREQAHCTHGHASSRVQAGRALADDLPGIAQALLEELVPDRSEKRREDKEAVQRLHLSDTPDGGRPGADLDAESTAILRAALDKYLPAHQPGAKASYRRALALIEMARQALDFGTDHPGAANKPHLAVSLSAEQLRSELGVGYLPDGTTLPATTIRRLACDAKIIPVLLGTDGVPLDIGRTSRTIPVWIRTALNLRDKGCAHPRCDRPPSSCDAHHVTPWVDGGHTALHNLLLLCRRHHTDHHKGRYTITPNGNGRFTFSPTFGAVSRT